MKEAEQQIGETPCGCRVDRKTGLKTHFCQRHAAATLRGLLGRRAIQDAAREAWKQQVAEAWPIPLADPALGWSIYFAGFLAGAIWSRPAATRQVAEAIDPDAARKSEGR